MNNSALTAASPGWSEERAQPWVPTQYGPGPEGPCLSRERKRSGLEKLVSRGSFKQVDPVGPRPDAAVGMRIASTNRYAEFGRFRRRREIRLDLDSLTNTQSGTV